MRIAHINFSDYREGVNGAVRSLMDAQQEQGDQPVLFTPNRRTQDNNVISLTPAGQGWQEAMLVFEQKEQINGLSAGHLFSCLQDPEFLQADVIHLHVISADYFSLLLLPALASKPLVWTLYDSQAYTAGCYHTFICNRWQQQQCRECPLTAPGLHDKQEALFMLKKAMYDTVPMAVVSPNPWLTAQIRGSSLSRRWVAEIPALVDPAFFRKASRDEVRRRLGIARDAFVVAVVTQGGINHPLFGGPQIRQIFADWQTDNKNVVLLQLGTGDNETPLTGCIQQKTLPYGALPEQRSAVLQAADIFLQVSPHDAVGIHMLEAAAAGVPSIAFPAAAAGSWINHLADGFLAATNAVPEMVKGLRFLRTQPELVKKMGTEASLRIRRQQQGNGIAKEYTEIYQAMRNGDARDRNNEAAESVGVEIPADCESLEKLWQLTGIPERFERVAQKGIKAIWKDLEEGCRAYSAKREGEKGVFVDLYLAYYLRSSKQPMQPVILIELIEHWLRLRQMPMRCGRFLPAEKTAAQAWTALLRQAMEKLLTAMPLDYFNQLTYPQQGRLIDFWRTLFFNDFAIPYLEEAMHVENRRRIEATTSSQRLYPDLLIRSMYSPYPPAAVRLDTRQLLQRNMPIALQVILFFWSVIIPFYQGDEKRQQVMRRNAAAFLQGLMAQPDYLPQNLFVCVIEHFVPQYWRAAYLGGNLVKDLSLFGDYIHQQIQRFYPGFNEVLLSQPLAADRRLRVGYISTNFCNQAVSFYMANRIINADKQKFEIQVFSLEKRHDNLTDRIKAYSDRYVSFKDVSNLAMIADSLKKSELDILIYADIGMEQVTYQLGAMRLAPIQCVMVGHGATTGLPTIDYYISGDFEAPEAQEHYREKLIRLPNLGAAQLPPPSPATGKMTRQKIGLPENAVILVSCANGIKHGADRDALLIEILQKAPEAIIALKPFMDPSMVQPKWIERVESAARQGGVADRLIIIPPLAHSNELMDFLALADIQLDTYPYGGWTTNLEALYAGLAIVTQEGKQARSRWGAYMLRALGIDAGIAANEREFVQQAVALVKDHALRQNVRGIISRLARDVLFNGPVAQQPFEAELLRIHSAALAAQEAGV